MKKKVFLKTKHNKKWLTGSIISLGIIAHYSSAAAITDIPHYDKIRDKLPSTVTDYYIAGGALYGSSNTNVAYVQDNTTASGTSMPGTIYIDARNYDRPVMILGDDVTIKQSATDETDGIRTNGGTPTAQGTVIAGDRLTIHLTGTDSDGINMGYWTQWGFIPTQGSNLVYIGDYLNITTEGDKGRGISAYQVAGSANTNTVTVGDFATITTTGDYSEGVRVGGNSTGTINNSVITGNNATIKTTGNASIALRADNATIKTGSNAKVITDKDESHGVYTTGTKGNITLGNNASITTQGANTTYSVYAANGGAVTLEGGATIRNAGTHATNSYAIYSTGSNSYVDGSAAGIYKITGDINAADNGKIELNMASTSLWEGAAYINSDTSNITMPNSGTSNITMANNTTWNMTGHSQVSALNSSGTVNFQSSPGNYYRLTTGSLSGNATFGMNVDMVGQQGDLIDVTDTNVSGNHQLIIANKGNANTNGTEVLTVVKTLDNTQGSFASNTVEVGAYQYNLRQKADGKEWELYGTPNGSSSGSGSITTTANASVNLLSNNYLLNYIDTQTLLQRMGQLRANTNQQGDFWIRSFAGKLNSFGGSNTHGFDMSYKGTQAGIDKLISTDSGHLYLGAMVGFTDGDPDYRGGHGTTKDYHFGLYSTYMTDNGLYVDGVIKYTHIKNRFNVKDTLGNSITGKGTSEGYSASIETGKRFYLSSSNKGSGYYIEPQAQITYGYQGGMNINGSNGLKTKLSNYNFALGRAGAIAGYTIEGANPIDIYIKTGYVREFDGKTSYRFNQGKKINHSFKGGWWDNGIGINAKIKGKHNIYADINYATGSRFDQKQLNIGYRYSF